MNIEHLVINWPVSIQFEEIEKWGLFVFPYAFCNLWWRKIDDDDGDGGGFAIDLKMHAWLAFQLGFKLYVISYPILIETLKRTKAAKCL